MKSTTQHLGVPQLQADYIQTVLLQELDQSCLIFIDYDQIRIDAQDILIDPVLPMLLAR